MTKRALLVFAATLALGIDMAKAIADPAESASGPTKPENWPAWRGPRGDGTSLESNVPTRWSATENVAWKTAVPGAGHSSPIVWGERVFLTTAVPEKFLVSAR